MDASTAGGDLTLVQTSQLFLLKGKLVRTTYSVRTNKWFTKYQNRITSSLTAIQRPSHFIQTTRKLFEDLNNRPMKETMSVGLVNVLVLILLIPLRE